MNIPCCLTKDLLPLYHDGVCSAQSTSLLQAHLQECADCRQAYTALCAAESAESSALPASAARREVQKAASFRAIRRKLQRKQLAAAALALVLLAACLFTAAGILKNSESAIECSNALSVTLTGEGLVSRLQGNEATRLHAKRVEIAAGDQLRTCLFFCLSGTKWDSLFTSAAVYSEYVLCPADKGAGEIDAVYYYTGELAGLESLSAEELQAVLHAATLLWQRE